MSEPKMFPPGTRVHHGAQLWTFGWTEEQRQADPQWGWGTVIRAVPQQDRTVEYEVQKDAPLLPEMSNEPTWWASYHIDQSEVVPEPVGGKREHG